MRPEEAISNLVRGSSSLSVQLTGLFPPRPTSAALKTSSGYQMLENKRW